MGRKASGFVGLAILGLAFGLSELILEAYRLANSFHMDCFPSRYCPKNNFVNCLFGG
jgi:hypothetical protein